MKKPEKYYMFVATLWFLIASLTARPQDVEYAKKIITNLCSEKYKGRGYTSGGCNKSAYYIISELKKNGVQPAGNSYYQGFEMPVCVVSGLGTVRVDGKIVEPGTGFSMHPGSAQCNGTYNLLWISDSNIKSLFNIELSNTFLVIDTIFSGKKENKEAVETLRYSNPLNAKGVIYLVKKNPMHIQRSEKINWTGIEAYTHAFPEKAEKICISFKQKYIPEYKTQNIVAEIPGTSDSLVVFTAHYDHLGELGETYFPGANDNASGVAMLLDLSRSLAKQKNKFTYMFIFFTGEEIGLVGSSYYVANPVRPLKKIRFLLNLDVIGSGENGITAVNGSVFGKEFNILKSINDSLNLLPVVKERGEANNSDHAPFYLNKVRCFFIYAMGKTGPYHHPHDTPENLSLGKYNEIIRLLLLFTEKL